MFLRGSHLSRHKNFSMLDLFDMRCPSKDQSISKRLICQLRFNLSHLPTLWLCEFWEFGKMRDTENEVADLLPIFWWEAFWHLQHSTTTQLVSMAGFVVLLDSSTIWFERAQK